MKTGSYNVRAVVLIGSSILPLFAAAVLADQPQFKAMMFESSKDQHKATVPADQQADRAFYYSNGKKILLNSTGLAVVQLKREVDPDSKDLKVRASIAAPVGPLAELVPMLRKNGMVIVTTEGPNALDVSKAATNHPDEVANALPIVEPDPGPMGLNPNARPTQLIVTPRVTAGFKKWMTRQQVEDYLQGTGLKVSAEPEVGPDKDGYQLELAEGPVTFTKLLQAANKLYEKGKGNGTVLFSHPDFIATKFRQGDDVPTDPLLDKQWHLDNTGASSGKAGADVRAFEAWTVTMGDPSIRVAIIDDSVEKDHPDLAANFVVGRYYNGVTSGFTDDPSPVDGTQRHGTACAGVAVGAANDKGGRGVAPKCGLIGVNIWDGSVSQVAKAFYFADQKGASVISCSWTWGATFDGVSSAIKDLAVNGRNGKGTVVLFAAANDYGAIATHQDFGRMNEVMLIGATNWRDDHSKYSNFGPELCVCAPSSDFYDIPISLSILTSDNTDNMPLVAGQNYSGYVVGDFTPNSGVTGFGGTSAATPLTAGVCALVLSCKPSLTAAEVRSIIESTADKVPGETVLASYDTKGHDDNYGYGRVNAKKAVDKASGH